MTLDDIRRAIGANLRLVLPEDEGHVGPFFRDDAKPPALQVMGVTDYELDTIGGAYRYEIGIEGILGRLVDRASQARLDGWIESMGIVNALDSSVHPLTSRLLDDGTVAEEEEDAGVCNYLRFGGQGRFNRQGTDLLVATWFCEVFPPPESWS